MCSEHFGIASYPHTHESKRPYGVNRKMSLRIILAIWVGGYRPRFPFTQIPLSEEEEPRINLNEHYFFPDGHLPCYPQSLLPIYPLRKYSLQDLGAYANKILSAFKLEKHQRFVGGTTRQKTKTRAQKNQPASWFVCGGRR